MSRPGKIERLPKAIRDNVDKKLEDGMTAREIIGWLNQLPEVQNVLARNFGNEPISDTNFSNWRNGRRAELRRTAESRDDFAAFLAKLVEAKEGEHIDLQAHLSLFLTAEMARDCARLNRISAADERSKRRSKLIQENYRLRRADFTGARMRLEMQKHQELQSAFDQGRAEMEKATASHEELREQTRQITGTDEPEK